MIQDFTVEELKTSVGFLMLDIRTDWGKNYNKKLLELKKILEVLNEKDLYYSEYSSDLEITNSEIEDMDDGRIFRDCCVLSSLSGRWKLEELN